MKIKYKERLQSVSLFNSLEAAWISRKNCNLCLVLFLVVKMCFHSDSLIPAYGQYFELHWSACHFFFVIWDLMFFWSGKKVMSFIQFGASDLATLNCVWIAFCACQHERGLNLLTEAWIFLCCILYSLAFQIIPICKTIWNKNDSFHSFIIGSESASGGLSLIFC